MKRIFTILALISMVVSIFAQAPNKMSYQAVVRSSSNQLVTNHTVGMRISILQSTVTGTAVYVETQNPTSNANGLVTVEIGGGTVVSGTFASINWANGPYFIKTETDPTGGTNYSILGTSQLLSVPYALMSKSAENGFASVYAQTEKRPILDESGNISIGEPFNGSWWLSPKLNVNGSVNVLPGGSNCCALLALDASTVSGGQPYIIASLGDQSGEGAGKFLIRNDGYTSLFIMDNDGRVGIGNMNPAYKLDVSGDINFTGSLLKEGSPFGGDYNALTNKPDLTFYATKNMENQNITNLADPVNLQDAATKAYVNKLIEILSDELLLAGLNGVVFDPEGNVYKTIKIGNQIWMSENLAYLPAVSPPSSSSDTQPLYYVYGYNGTSVSEAKATANYGTYGVLYNWPAAMAGKASSNNNPSGVQGVCPSGWHLPSDAEWTELSDYLGGQTLAGGKLKEEGTSHWASPNTEATNESGFTALPGGYRKGPDVFDKIGVSGEWWSATVHAGTVVYSRSLSSSSGYFFRNYSYGPTIGTSVRCVKD